MGPVPANGRKTAVGKAQGAYFAVTPKIYLHQMQN